MEKYKLLEKCSKCKGKCCKFMVIWFGENADKDMLKWISYHEKCKVRKSIDGGMEVRFELKCKKLRNGKCSIYKNRPKLCKEFDCKEWSLDFPNNP